jgi:hypothetical protein
MEKFPGCCQNISLNYCTGYPGKYRGYKNIDPIMVSGTNYNWLDSSAATLLPIKMEKMQKQSYAHKQSKKIFTCSKHKESTSKTERITN